MPAKPAQVPVSNILLYKNISVEWHQLMIEKSRGHIKFIYFVPVHSYVLSLVNAFLSHLFQLTVVDPESIS
jgi:hypothetical protein